MANFADNSTSNQTLKWQLNNMIFDNDKDMIESYVARTKGIQSKLKQLKAGLDEEVVEAICKGLPRYYESVKQDITVMIVQNPSTSLDTVLHILSK
jgi:hypothetical protein